MFPAKRNALKYRLSPPTLHPPTDTDTGKPAIRSPEPHLGLASTASLSHVIAVKDALLGYYCRHNSRCEMTSDGNYLFTSHPTTEEKSSAVHLCTRHSGDIYRAPFSGERRRR